MARMPKAAAVAPSPKVMYFVCAYDWAIGHPRKSTRNRRVRRSNDTEHAHAIALLMQIKGRRTGGRLRRFFPSLMGSRRCPRRTVACGAAVRATSAAWMRGSRPRLTIAGQDGALNFP